MPLIALGAWLFLPAGDILKHLADTVLLGYVLSSLKLTLACTIGTFLIGTTTAWLCSVCDFPGKSFYRWALFLPLAYPSYIIAYIYTGVLDYGGSIYLLMRDYLALQEPLPIRSIYGASTCISITLYPYIYLLAYSAWCNNSKHLLEMGCLLQATPWNNFLRIALPVARPAIVAGVAIVAMETLADYGTVQYFGIGTLSLGIMNTWFGLNSLAGAAQLSFALLTFIVALMFLERKKRKEAHYTLQHVPSSTAIYRLRHWKAVLANIACAVPILLGFVIPSLFLVRWTLAHTQPESWSSYVQLWVNTVSIALLATVVIVTASIILAYARRLYTNTKLRAIIQIIASGYVIPGVVVAAAVMSLSGFAQSYAGWVLSGTMVALILGYAVRFMTLGVNSLSAGLEKISLQLDDSAKLLNVPSHQILSRIHLPLIRPAVVTAALLVFVDIVKELPITLSLRPFDFNTFSVKAYELASDERISEIGFPALNIMLIGLLPLIFFMRSMKPRK